MAYIQEAIKIRKNPKHAEDMDAISLLPCLHFSEIIKDNKEKPMLLNWGIIVNPWLKVPEEMIKLADEIQSLLFDIFAIFDDICDGSEMRNGNPVVHSIYEMNFTMLSSMQYLFMALKKLENFNHPDAWKCVHEQLIALFRGWATESYWTEFSVIPTEEQHAVMACQTSGDFILISVRLLQLLSSNKADLSTLIYLVGLYTQVVNDRNNLKSKEYCQERGFGDDITEGKFTFPALHAIGKEQPDVTIRGILKKKTRNPVLKRYCAKLMEKQGSFEYCEKQLAHLDKLIDEEAAKLGPNPRFEEYMKTLRGYAKQTRSEK